MDVDVDGDTITISWTPNNLAPHHELVKRVSRSVRRAGYPVVLTDRGCAYRRTIESALRGITLPTVIQAGNPSVMRELVSAGLGVGVMPTKAAVAPNTATAPVGWNPRWRKSGCTARPSTATTS